MIPDPPAEAQPITRPWADLHIHSWYSDGRSDPQALVRCARRRGLQALAITDHDNIRGVIEAQPFAKSAGLELVPGIEFTSTWEIENWNAQNADVLGYFIDLEAADLQRMIASESEDFYARVEECCALFTQNGYPLTVTEVLAANPRFPGDVAAIEALMNKGYFRQRTQANLALAHTWDQVRLAKTPTWKIIETIHAAGGVAMLAHPITIKSDAGWLQAKHIAALYEMGLDGLEVFTRRLDDTARHHFLRLAQQFDMTISGGSDEHGSSDDLRYLGRQPVTADMLSALRARSTRWN